MATEVIRLENIEKVYGRGFGAVHALRGLSVQVEAGELIAVVGPSGSGKTTLLDIIGLLTKPTDGRFALMGEEVGDLNDRQRARLRNATFGYVRQDFALIDSDTAFENVVIPLHYAKPRPTKAERIRRVFDALERVGLERDVGRKMSTMSGGERQRVAIARALVNATAVVLADEPTGSVDSKNAQEVFLALASLRDRGTTVMIATHNQSIAAQCDRTLTLHDGVAVDTTGPIGLSNPG